MLDPRIGGSRGARAIIAEVALRGEVRKTLMGNRGPSDLTM